MTGLTVTELHTQDGYDWPNGVAHEHWPAHSVQPMAPYFREQMEPEMVPLPKPRQLTVRAKPCCARCLSPLTHPDLACSRGCYERSVDWRDNT